MRLLTLENVEVNRIFLKLANFQNPREASSRSRIFLFSVVNMLVCDSVCRCVCTAPFSHNEKRYRPQIWCTYSHRPYLKTFFFCFFDQITMTAASVEKLPCHVDCPHISSIALLIYFFTFLLIFHDHFPNFL